MKKLILFLLLAISTRADDLIWDDPNPAGTVKSFTIWKEVDLGVWEAIDQVSEPKWKIMLPAGVHRMAVSANGSGELSVSSALSEPRTFTVLIVPANVRIEK